jgi:phage baseplate assembly protein W
MNLQFPYGFDLSGRTALSDLPRHIEDMVELVLLTSPGERVNRPTFGSGTAQLVFAPNSDTLAAALQQIIKAGLQQWLSDLIQVQSVQVSNIDSTLLIAVQYTVIQTQQPQTSEFIFGAGAP